MTAFEAYAVIIGILIGTTMTLLSHKMGRWLRQ